MFLIIKIICLYFYAYTTHTFCIFIIIIKYNIMEKITEIKYKLQSGKEVFIKIRRTHGFEKETNYADGYNMEISVFKDNYSIYIAVPEMGLAEKDCILSKSGQLDILKYWDRHQCYSFALPEDILKKIHSTIKERLTLEVSPETKNLIETIKGAISSNMVLPESQRKKKEKEHNDIFNDGGSGYNPYIYYVSQETVDQLKSDYPEQFDF